MSIVNWSDLPDTVEEFVQKYGDVPTVLSGQEQQAVEALRLKVKENNDWQPLYDQVCQSIDDVEDDDDASSISDSDSNDSYEHVMQFNKLLRKNPSDSVLKRLHECFTDNVAKSDDANLTEYVALAPYTLTSNLDIQSNYVRDLDLIVDCVDSQEQDYLDAETVARAAVYSRNFREKKIKNLEKEVCSLKRRKNEDDDEPIVKRVAFKNEV